MADRYEIKGRLGRGGIGAVYQAFDSHLGRDVAIKRLLPMDETRLNESAEFTLESEAKTLAALQHPNIVTIFEFGEDEQGPFVVFELIDGDTLKDLIAGGALSEIDFYEVADQILDALIAAQKMNVLHRDIKPANIMLSWLPSGKFQIKMLDFGLSKFAQEPSTQTLDQAGSFLGSIDYIAPEQIELFPLDQRTDLYSLGCVLYFSLTQRAPFTGESMAETMNNHLAGKVVPLEDMRPDLPIAVCRWVMSLISLHPSERPDDALAAMETLLEAKETSNQSITDSIPTAKLVVPVVETAQPTLQPRTLEYTQQIVTTPAPMALVVPPHPQTDGHSRMITGRYKPKKNVESISRNSILGLAGSVLALIMVCGIMLAKDRKDRKKPKVQQVLATTISKPPTPKKPAKPNPPKQIPAKVNSGAPITYENSGTPTDLPELPLQESLIAYYSVLGHLQNKNGYRYNVNADGLILGAIENAAPGAHQFHLIKSPDADKQIPAIVDNWTKTKTIQFLPGQKLMTSRYTWKQQMQSDIFTFAFILNLPEGGTGTLLRVGTTDRDNKYYSRSIILNFSHGNLLVMSENIDEQLKMEIHLNEYRAVIMQLDATNQTISLWQRSSNEKSETLVGDTIAHNLAGPLRLKNYEFGNIAIPGNRDLGRLTEIPALAIYSGSLSEPEKKELAIGLFKSLKKPEFQ